MPQFILKINLGNDMMQSGYNVAECLKRVSKDIGEYQYLLNPEFKGTTKNIKDLDGNTVGSWQIK